MEKTYLLTPGPTPIPPEVIKENVKPIIHHRTAEFSKVFDNVLHNLKYVFQTKQSVLVFASSGTGAMEATVVNLLSTGDKALVLDTGVFGQRWAKIIKTYGLNPIVIAEEWGTAVCIDKVQETLNKEKDIKAIFTTLTETSTGVVNNIKALAKIVKKTDTVLVVDAISGLCGQELKTDEWGVDVAIAGSQKGLMIPPGLSFVSINKKAWELVEKSNLPKFYFDFKAAQTTHAKAQTPFTPAISLIVELNKALELIKIETIESVWKRHEKMAQITRKALVSLGLELFAKNPCNVVTSVHAPKGIDTVDLVKKLRTEQKVIIAGGQQTLKGKIFRIAHLGYMNKFDLVVGLSALEIVLKQMGVNIPLGKSIATLEEGYL